MRYAETSSEGASRPQSRVTIIRPVKGLEPYLYECLASTFQQTYPKESLTIYFCISDRDDPALPTLERLIMDYPSFDARILVEAEDPFLLQGNGRSGGLGPNPKIRNMSRAYREAKSDILWIVDCNVWVGPDVARQMVDLLCGFNSDRQGRSKKFKFVHQLPLSIDMSQVNMSRDWTERFLNAGGLLEETFLSTSHAKFYTAINVVAIAPCIVGKSNMFRRSHLDALTEMSNQKSSERDGLRGIDHFSYNICEDHLIGDLLWKSSVPMSTLEHADREGGDGDPTASSMLQHEWGNHAMLAPRSPENLAIQPTMGYSLRTYIDRRVRWLRVRKFTVTLATLVEPGTESFLCSLYGAFAVTTLPFVQESVGIPQTWIAFVLVWLFSMLCWACVDRWTSSMLTRNTVNVGPSFWTDRPSHKPLKTWVLGWLGREALAFPIWAWAFFGGVTVVWRGRRFWVGLDMRVHEIDIVNTTATERHLDSSQSRSTTEDTGSGGESGRKRRRD